MEDETDHEFKLLQELRAGQLETNRILGQLVQSRDDMKERMQDQRELLERFIQRLGIHEDNNGAHGIKVLAWVFGTIISIGVLIVTAIPLLKK